MTAGSRINCSHGVGSKTEKNRECWASANSPLIPSQGMVPLLGSFQLNRIKITPHIHAQSLVCLGILHPVIANIDHYVNTVFLLMIEISPHKKKRVLHLRPIQLSISDLITVLQSQTRFSF